MKETDAHMYIKDERERERERERENSNSDSNTSFYKTERDR